MGKDDQPPANGEREDDLLDAYEHRAQRAIGRSLIGAGLALLGIVLAFLTNWATDTTPSFFLEHPAVPWVAVAVLVVVSMGLILLSNRERMLEPSREIVSEVADEIWEEIVLERRQLTGGER